MHNCHLVNHKDEGGYRDLIAELRTVNPRMRVIGLTATPYRLGHGYITDAPAIFDALIMPPSAGVKSLIASGFLARLDSKATKMHLDVTGVHKRGGDYIESELQAAVDTDTQNRALVDETILRARDRKAWLFFCSGVVHATHIKELLVEKGIPAEVVTGETPSEERRRIIEGFKAGTIRALTNANVLTTGFDHPDIDLLVFARPTESPGLYVQMAGRGMRLKSHTDHCLVLDFAGLVERHGPVTAVLPPDRKGDGDGVAPSKTCPECDEIVHLSAVCCPACGYVWPEKPKDLKLRDADIMGDNAEALTREVTAWKWTVQTSKSSGLEMIVVSYYGGMAEMPIKEYLCVFHPGFAGEKGRRLAAELARKAEVSDLSDLENLSRGRHPNRIKYVMDGKFTRVVDREREDDEVPF